MSEVLGRSYGGGLLEIEPTEAVALPVPNPELVDEAPIAEVDALLREGEIEATITLIDQRFLVTTGGSRRVSAKASIFCVNRPNRSRVVITSVSPSWRAVTALSNFGRDARAPETP
jgi:hypothetical protein